MWTYGLQVVCQPDATTLGTRIRFQDERAFVVERVVHGISIAEIVGIND